MWLCECVFVFQHISNIRGTMQIDLQVFSCLCSGHAGSMQPHGRPSRPAAPTTTTILYTSTTSSHACLYTAIYRGTVVYVLSMYTGPSLLNIPRYSSYVAAGARSLYLRLYSCSHTIMHVVPICIHLLLGNKNRTATRRPTVNKCVANPFADATNASHRYG